MKQTKQNDTASSDEQTVLTQLREEWGDAFDDNLAAAKRAVQKHGGKKMVEALEDSGLGNDPRIIKAFAELGLGSQQDQSNKDDADTENDEAAEAKSAIAQILSDKSHAYWNPRHPEHKDALERVTKLFQAAHPDRE